MLVYSINAKLLGSWPLSCFLLSPAPQFHALATRPHPEPTHATG